MFYVYVLYSAKLKKRYVGSTDDIPKRLRLHNAGRSRFTSGGFPWALVHSESFNTRSEARKRERFLKPDLRNDTSDRTRNNNVPTGPEANTRSPLFHIQTMAPMAFPESQYLRRCMAAPVKKNSKTKTLARSEALDEALCFGWIDGQEQKSDGESWLQKFTPATQKHVVETEPRTCRAAYQRKADDTGRTGTNQVRQSRWTVETSLRFAGEHVRTGGLFTKTEEKQNGPRLLQNVEQGEHLCDRVEVANRQKAGDTRATYGENSSDACGWKEVPLKNQRLDHENFYHPSARRYAGRQKQSADGQTAGRTVQGRF
jgi:putative endonuclease